MPAGQPRKYKSPEEMQIAIDAYFDKTEKISICGLALGLGFCTRQSLVDYEGYSKEFLATIKRAKTRVEDYYEQHLVESGAAGSIFALKNFNWKDRQETVNLNIEADKATVKEVQSMLRDGDAAGDGIPIE